MSKYPTYILLNDFAIRSFRDIGDNDYITARLAHRAQLGPQFLWAALQAIEKYLKCILVLNRIAAPNGHHLGELLDSFKNQARFQLQLTETAIGFIKHLDLYGRHRYFETSYWIKDMHVVDLDRTVWEIRRYTQIIDRETYSIKEENPSAMQDRLAAIEDAINHPPQRFAIPGGRLEIIVASSNHPARGPLLWKNLFYGKRARKSILIPDSFHASNAPLLLHPEILDEVLKYVYLPKAVIQAYREHAANGNKH